MRRLGLTVLMGIFLLELCARVICYTVYQKPFWDNRKFVPDDQLIWKLNPGYEGRWNRDIFLKINSQGLVGPELRHPKDDGTIRIIIAGSSVTFGRGCENYDSTCISLLDELLQQKDDSRKYELFNASVPGYSSYNGMLFVNHKLRALDADVLIIAFGWNDATRDLAPDKSPDKSWTIYSLAISGAVTYSYIFQYLRFLHKYIQALKPLRPRFFKRDLPFRVPPDDFHHNMTTIIDTCREIGVQPILLCEPHPRGFADRTGQVHDHEMYLRVLREISMDMGVPLADADSAMASRPTRDYFDNAQTQFTYPNAKGQHLMAQILAETLQRSGCLK
jgi:lysophospholipase L1-like esterase